MTRDARASVRSTRLWQLRPLVHTAYQFAIEFYQPAHQYLVKE